MINHVRTLLLNRDGEIVPAGAHPAEEYVPVYKSVPIGFPLLGVYQALYGTDPDYEGRLYRTAQYMGILHSTEFVSYALALDPRITYDPQSSGLLLQEYNRIITTTGPQALTVLGDWEEAGYKGRIRTDWVVLLDGSQVTAIHTQTGYSYTRLLTFAPDGTSDTFALPQSDLRALIIAPGTPVSQRWDIRQRTRPTQDLSEILEAVDGLPGTIQRALFGVSNVEPYASFNRLFTDGGKLSFRLSGVLLALAYRLEALRAP